MCEEKINYKLILNRLKSEKNLQNDTQLASFLDTTQSNIANWKNRNSGNLAQIITHCGDIDLNWLIFGEAKSAKRTAKEPTIDILQLKIQTLQEHIANLQATIKNQQLIINAAQQLLPAAKQNNIFNFDIAAESDNKPKKYTKPTQKTKETKQ